jgi:hypothetical protein
MRRLRMVRFWSICLVTLGLMACAAVRSPSPFPVLGRLSPAEKAQLLQARSTGIHTLAAVLTMSFTAAEQQRTFDMVVNYDAAGSMRFTAFKDVGLSTSPIFDLLFAGERYSLELQDATGRRIHQGEVTQFVRDQPAFSAFLVIGEAFFLPGFDGHGNPPVFTSTSARRFTTLLRSGATAQWFARPETLEITRARIASPMSFDIRYSDYRRVEAYYLPGRVTLVAPRLKVTTQAWLKQVEVNMPLAPGIFDLPAARQGQSLPHTAKAARQR